MRILFAFAGGAGHFEPLVPVARAAEAAGHVVAVAGRPAAAAAVAAARFRMIPVGPQPRERAPVERQALVAVDRAREEREFAEGFAWKIAHDRAGRLLDVCTSWRPDLLVCDEADFGAMVAAERLRLPYASVVVLVAGVLARPEVVAEPLRRLREEYRLPPDPELRMLARHLVLAPLPGRFRDPAHPLPAAARGFRPFNPHSGPAEAPPYEPGSPLVYFTLGTVFNVESGDLFGRVLEGLKGLDATVVATVGRQVDPAEFGPQPPNVHIERYVPQERILPSCDVMVSHAGSGSVVGALAHGVPSVLLPMGADQPFNADRCAALGVGRVLDPLTVTPDELAAAVREMLAEPGYRAAAREFQAEIAAMPGPDHAVALLEGLATAS